MKYLANKLLFLFLVFICLSVSNSFAQNTFEDTANLTTPINMYYEEQVYQDYLEQYYKGKTAKEIWRDYWDIRSILQLEPNGLVDSSRKFQEPFKTFASEEIIKLDLPGSSMASFLAGDYGDKYKESVFEKNINRSDYGDFYVRVGRIDYLIHVMWTLSRSYNDGDVRRSALPYINKIMDRIVDDPDLFTVPNYNLSTILPFGSMEQKKKISSIMLNNNPLSTELDLIIDAEIEIYSDMAKQMKFQNSVLNSDAGQGEIWTRLNFLAQKMENLSPQQQ